LLSNDLGAIAGLLYEIGSGGIALAQSAAANVLSLDPVKIEGAMRKRHAAIMSDQKEDDEHLKIQHMLTKVGRSLGYDVHVASNDRSKSYAGEALSFLTLGQLPDLGLSGEVAQTVALIDVLWLKNDSSQIECAFEIEKSTSIYSGILRLLDLARELGSCENHFFLVAPDCRRKEVEAQLRRPSFANLGNVHLHYILFSSLCEHCASLCKLGDDYRILLKIAGGG
ncbi:MAG: hypothetical protein M1133_14330, partial [Armatimonadetes bacterium]|nr:hypothetical protein [Armatimonadota bacterium]